MGYAESLVETRLIKEINKLGGMCLKFTSPGHRGVADRICIMPKGITDYVETKSDVGTLSELQKLFKRRLEARGHKVWVLDSIPAILLYIEDLKKRLNAV